MSLKLKDLNMGKFSMCLLVSLLALIPAAASAQTIPFNFAVPTVFSTIGTTPHTQEAPLVWYADRYSPCGFTAASGVLTESVCPVDFQTPNPNFADTQGNKFDLLPGTTSVSIYVYVPSTWTLLPERLAGFWATAVDSTYNPSGGDYPIIEFQGPTTTPVAGPSYYPNGGVAGFYGWNNTTSGWDFIGLPAGFKYNSWVKLTMTLTPAAGLSPAQLTYTVGTGGTAVSKSSPLSDPTDTYLTNVILEAYNYDTPYSIKWKSLSFSFNSNGQLK